MNPILSDYDWAALVRLCRPRKLTGRVPSELPDADAFAKRVLDRAIREPPLTPALQEITLRSAMGECPADIARRRGAKCKTVRSQMGQIYRRLGVADHGEFTGIMVHRVIAIARELGAQECLQ